MKMKKLTNSNIRKFNNTIRVSEDDEDDDDTVRSPSLGYFRKTQTSSLIEIPIDEEVKGPSYYRNVAQAIRDSDEGDLIRFFICSPGGRLDGLMSLLSSMWKTDATTEAHIEGFCDSASSMLAMHCDNVYVSPMASMLVHQVQYGVGGKSADIQAHVAHFTNYSETFFRDTYQYFLTDEEIQKCIDGYQLYLNAEQIAERLQRKFEIIQELSEQAEQDDADATNYECNPNDCSTTRCAGYSDGCIKDKAVKDVLSRLEDTAEENQGVDSRKGSKTRRKASKAI